MAEGLGWGDPAGVATLLLTLVAATAIGTPLLVRSAERRRTRQAAEAGRLADDIAHRLANGMAAADASEQAEPLRADPQEEGPRLDLSDLRRRARRLRLLATSLRLVQRLLRLHARRTRLSECLGQRRLGRELGRALRPVALRALGRRRRLDVRIRRLPTHRRRNDGGRLARRVLMVGELVLKLGLLASVFGQ